ncbi:MAG: alpha amylase N-terminal ig-like domain-containing protein [Phycisphaerae bacterium]
MTTALPITPARRPTRRLLLAACTAMLTLAPAGARGTEHISLAGSFNGWSPNDGDTRLKQDGNSYVLTRFWPAGTSEFKFVFDASWERHFGEAEAGRLAQPGRNITLSIPQSMEYRLWLDLDRKTWGLEVAQQSRPHAVILIPDPTAATIELGVLSTPGFYLSNADGVPSNVAAENLRAAAPRFSWHARRLDQGPPNWTLDSRSGKGPATRLHLKDPGRYEIKLTAASGEIVDTTTRVCELGRGWELVRDDPENDQLTGRRMMPLADGAWGCVYHARKDGVESLFVRSVLADTSRDGVASASRPFHEGTDYLAQYDPRSGTFSFRDSGWHEFVLATGPRERVPLPRPIDGPTSLRDVAIERVEWVGDQNGWKPGATPMIRHSPGVYRCIVELPDGVQHYRFLVNGAVWLEDPDADPRLRAPDGRGGHNSGVRIGVDVAALGPASPDHITIAALRHDPAQPAFFAAVTDDVVRLTVRTLAHDVQSVAAVVEGAGRPTPLRKTASHDGFDDWTAQVRAVTSESRYTFLIRDGRAVTRLTAAGAVPAATADLQPFRRRRPMDFKTPDWTKTAVWYQIFPERFRNGDPANDPPRTVPWTQAWFKPYRPDPARIRTGSPQDFVEEGTFFDFIYDRRYGGDIQGIRDRLPYLRDLGVTAIYLNPIFSAASLHKYDTADYRHVDDFFGVKGSLDRLKPETEDPATWQWSDSDRVFLDLLKQAHRQGFRVILDGVFNHVGREFWAFQDVLKNGRKSKYAGWFDIKSWEPFHYRAWDRDDGSLPRLKHDDAHGLCEPVRQHLFAVTRRWMDPDGDGDPSDGIDGWRLDVASDINAYFWRDWRKQVKSINTDAYIVAELWKEAGAWLTGDTFDAVMNYPFAERAQRFFVNRKKAIRPTVFARQLDEMFSWYPPHVNYALQNLFDSHDTDRVASMLMNPDLPYDKANRIQDNGPAYNPARPTPECYTRLKLMVTFQMTSLGAPMVYYGDEVGMYGADDPSDRKPMLWPDLMPFDDPSEQILPELHDHYRRMIAIRNTYPALQLGAFETLLANDRTRVFAYARSLDRETIVVVLNNGDEPRRLNVPVPWPPGTKIVRLDDPAACEVLYPPASDPARRPTVRPIAGHQTKLKVIDGHLRGIMLPPRTGGVFTSADIASR